MYILHIAVSMGGWMNMISLLNLWPLRILHIIICILAFTSQDQDTTPNQQYFVHEASVYIYPQPVARRRAAVGTTGRLFGSADADEPCPRERSFRLDHTRTRRIKGVSLPVRREYYWHHHASPNATRQRKRRYLHQPASATVTFPSTCTASYCYVMCRNLLISVEPCHISMQKAQRSSSYRETWGC